MKNTIKILGILLMSMFLVTSCGKDDDPKPNEEGSGNNEPNSSEAYDLFKDQNGLSYTVYILNSEGEYDIHKGTITFADKPYFDQIQDLLKNKTYNKIEDKSQEEIKTMRDDLTLETLLWFIDPYVKFYIPKDGKALVINYEEDLSIIKAFEVEGAIEEDKILEIIDSYDENFSL